VGKRKRGEEGDPCVNRARRLSCGDQQKMIAEGERDKGPGGFKERRESERALQGQRGKGFGFFLARKKEEKKRAGVDCPSSSERGKKIFHFAFANLREKRVNEVLLQYSDMRV